MARTSAESVLEVPSEPRAQRDSAADRGRDLEVLPLEGEPAGGHRAPRTRPRSHRWPLAIVAVTIVAGLLVMPVRANVAADQFRRLARLWSAAASLEPARSRIVGQLQLASVAGDLAHAAHGAAAVEDSEAARLVTLRRHLDGWLVPDGDLERLRNLMRRTMGRQIADLRAAAAALRRKAAAPSSPYSATSVAEAARVDREVAELRGRLGQSPPAPAAPVALPGAEADLAALNRYLDQPTGTVLVTADRSRRLSLLDLDRSRTSTLDLGSDTSATQVVTRRDFVAVLADTLAAGLVLATTTGADGPPRVLARQATSIVPAVGSDRLWVASDQQAIEVDGGGTVTTGPIPLPPNASLAGASASALYTERSDGELLVTTLADGATRVLAGSGQLIAAGASGVAWAVGPGAGGGTPASLEVSTDDGRTSWSVPHPVDAFAAGPALAVGPGAFSPDGRHLALWWLARANSPRTSTVFSVVDLTTGHVEIVAGTADDLVPQAVAWSASSRQVFLVRGQGTTQLWSYRPGAGSPEAVRVHGVETDAVAVAGG